MRRNSTLNLGIGASAPGDPPITSPISTAAEPFDDRGDVKPTGEEYYDPASPEAAEFCAREMEKLADKLSVDIDSGWYAEKEVQNLRRDLMSAKLAARHFRTFPVSDER